MMNIVRGIDITDRTHSTSTLRGLIDQIDKELDGIEAQMRVARLGEAFNLERTAKRMIQERGLLSAEVRQREPSFYATRAWKELRYKVLIKNGQRCQCCGASAIQGASLHVDHIKPRSFYPELALDESNLQILCGDCNIGKSNKDVTDFRPVLSLDQTADAVAVAQDEHQEERA